MTQHRVRELTLDGIAYAKRFLNDAREGSATDVPDDLLNDDRYAKPTATECFVEKRAFESRRDAGEYFSRVLNPLGIGYINGNYQLWSWLSMFYLTALTSRTEDGYLNLDRLPNQAVLIDPSETDLRLELFHRLMFAWETYRIHGDEYAKWILDHPVTFVPRLVDRLMTSRSRFSSHGYVKLVGLLYIDPNSGAVKRYAGGTKSIGGMRRLNDVLDQIYMTYDVYGMRAEQLLALLPDEFQRFNPAAGSAR